MTEREQLIEILSKPIYPHEDVDLLEAVADYLLDNGVTIQRWIPVTERLPEPMVDVVVYRPRMHYKYLVDHLYRGEFLYGRNIADEPCITHWMPLPAPPKEE